jgi:hypothetical protein
MKLFTATFAKCPKHIDVVLLPSLRIAKIYTGEVVSLDGELHDFLCFQDYFHWNRRESNLRPKIKISRPGGVKAREMLSLLRGVDFLSDGALQSEKPEQACAEQHNTGGFGCAHRSSGCQAGTPRGHKSKASVGVLCKRHEDGSSGFAAG